MSGKYALIIGNTEYTDPGLAQLTAPGRDAEDFARVLSHKEICAFDEVKTLLNQTSHIIREAIDEFFYEKRPDDLLVLYFSGHGVRDELGALYLAVKNSNRFRLRSTAIKSDFIREAMDQSRSKRQILILDCCNSGAFSQGTKAATGGSMGTSTAFESGYGRIILTASDATQYAWEGNKVIGETDNSLFTHFLVEGLEGNADHDGDGKITVDELYDYAYEQIKQATPKQTPSKFSSKQQGEIYLRESMRFDDIKPIPLPSDLIDEAEDLRPYVREAAVQKLERILKGTNIGLAHSAIDALQKIAEDENTTKRVAQVAIQVLESYYQVERKAEDERRAKEEAERLALLKAEEERLAREKTEAEQKAKQEAEKLARAKAAREAAEQEAARLKAERESAERAAKEAAEKAIKEKAEKEAAEREARLKAEREAMELASRKKTEREAAEKAELEAIELAARRKAEREAADRREAERELTAYPKEEREVKDKTGIYLLKTSKFLPLSLGIIGVALIGLTLFGYLSIRFLPTIFREITAPVTEIPATQVSATKTIIPQTPTIKVTTPNTETSPSVSNTCQSTTAISNGKVQIRWFVGLVGNGTNPEQVAVQEEVVADFNVSQDRIELVLEIVPFDAARDTLATQIASGAGPDIVGPVGWGGSNDFYGQWLNIAPCIQTSGFDTSIFDPALVKFYYTEEGQVGLPFAVFPGAVYFQPAMFDKAGLNYPPQVYGEKYKFPDGREADWNWETITEVAKLLTVDVNGKNATEKGFDRDNIVQVGYEAQYQSIQSVGTFYAGAAKIYSGDFKGSFQSTIPSSWNEAWKWYYDGMWGSQPFIATGPLSSAPEFGNGNVFNSGKAAMALTQSWYTCCLADYKNAGYKFQLAIQPIGTNGEVAGRVDADTFRILKSTKHPAEAFEVLVYLITTGGDKLLPVYGAMPAIVSKTDSFLTEKSRDYPFVTQKSWNVFVQGLAYPDIPSSEQYQPNSIQANARFTEFFDLLKNNDDLYYYAEYQKLIDDLNVIYNE